ncbi:hypothetical protein JVU11DRAFT_6336 [Chiua virens]|nr:hypothetical protein JVU11DRAFT_6336 [Chiua virens]
MAFDLLSRFRRPGPAPRDARQHPPPRPSPVVARLHTKRPAPVPQVRPQDRRGYHRSLPAPVVPRAPAPTRKVPAMRAPARPPPYRGPLRPLQCLHIHFHPSKKREAPPFPPPHAKFSKSSKFLKPSKPSPKAITSQQVPPYPPPRGATKPPPRHVHWAPAQAPLPPQPYPYPSHTSSRTSSSQSRKPTSSESAGDSPLPTAALEL